MGEHLSYNYSRLDNFLTKDYDPKEIGDRLDTIMSRLVSYVALNESYHEEIEEEHYLLNELRDIFWKLEKVKP
jgi:hypothetical protein